MITLDDLYVLIGLFFAGAAVLNLRDGFSARGVRNALFWGLNAVLLIFGSSLSSFASGCLLLASVAVIALGGTAAPPSAAASPNAAEPPAQAGRRLGNRIFIPALLVPLLTLAGTFVLGHVHIFGHPLIDTAHATLISLGLAVVVALVAGLVLLRQKPRVPLVEGRRLLDTIGWAAVLPQLLAALGGIFAAAGVGQLSAGLLTDFVPLDLPIIAVTAYCIGMALFTVIMGNAFAAFPVMTAGIGLPFIVVHLQGNPAIMAAIGMLSGYCGTLMTPMAANFNIVPAALLELPDQNAVIKIQIPTGAILLVANIVLMNLLVFRF